MMEDFNNIKIKGIEYPSIDEYETMEKALKEGKSIVHWEEGHSLYPIIKSREYCLVKPIKNIDVIMNIRANNTLAKADKNLLIEETKLFSNLNDFIYDSDFGYVVTQLIDSKIRAVSSESIILTFDFDSNVENSYFIYDEINDVYNKITKSNKKIAIISSSSWDKLKEDYIKKFKNKESLEYIKEPEPIFEELNNDDIIVSSAIELFGDIVEID